MERASIEMRLYLDDLKKSGLYTRAFFIEKLRETFGMPPERASRMVCDYLGVTPDGQRH
jgi:hypothetical protein